MTPADRLALEIGRLMLRAHTAEQTAEALAAKVRELEEAAKPKPKAPRKTA